jgi:hypothetical protein
MFSFGSLLCLAPLVSSLVQGQLIGPVGPNTSLNKKIHECNIIDYGAVADNETDVSIALNATFNDCVLKRPRSRLVAPPGNYLLKESLVFSNGTNWAFQLDGLITASYDGNWPVDRSLILQGFAGVDALNSAINGEVDKRFLLNVIVIVNGERGCSNILRTINGNYSCGLRVLFFERLGSYTRARIFVPTR